MGTSIAVVGATGMIGGALARALVARGDRVLAVSRGGSAGIDGATDVRWDPAEGPPPESVTGDVEAVVNLAGAPVTRWPWTRSYRRLIRESRVQTTRLLAERIGGDGAASLLINASGMDIYGDRGDETIDEGEPAGSGFLAQTAVAWESATEPARGRGARVVLVRTAKVLARSGGMLPRLTLPTKLMVGGPISGGRQWLPWIHLDDHLAVILACLDDTGLEGPVNSVAPTQVRQRDFMRTLGSVVGRPTILPAPAFAVRIALGEMAAVILNGQRAVPRLLASRGFAFEHPDLEPALRDLLDRR